MRTQGPRRFLWSTVIALGFTMALPVGFETAAADAGKMVTCKDGSTSKSGKGACGHHGGVQKGTSATSPSATPGSASSAQPAPAAAPNPKPAMKASASTGESTTEAGATAKCKDGTLSHSKHHSGACSHHGGVAQWLDQK
jgi:hypothetical protein